MTRASIPLRAVPWFVTAGVLAAGVAWRDCVLIASSALFAVHVFALRMDTKAPWAGWRAAIRCALMGMAAMAAGLALGAMVGAVLLGSWTPANDHPVGVMLMLAAAALACRACRPDAADWAFRVLADVVVPVAVMAAVVARSSGWDAAPCVFAALAAVGVCHAGWRLARGAGDLCIADGRW